MANRETKLLPRVITAVLLFAITIGVIILRSYYLLGYVSFFLVVGTYEICRTLRHVGRKTTYVIPMGAMLLSGVLYCLVSPATAFSVLILCVVAALSYLLFLPGKQSLEDISATVLPFSYPILPMLLLLGLSRLSYPYDLVGWTFLLVCTAGTDTFAYFIGMRMGKRKLCPHISPNKTVEGALAGTIGGFAVTVLTGYIFRIAGIMLPWWFIILSAAICCIAAQLGDLVASMIKRSCGLKDFGTIFPGHGGVLDRIDSYLFVGSILYVMITIFLI